MDELFRRAAENYPLDTKSSDWNKVLSALQNPEDKKGGQKDNRRRYLWLLLLLPLGWICTRYNMAGNENEKITGKTPPTSTFSAADEANKSLTPENSLDKKNKNLPYSQKPAKTENAEKIPEKNADASLEKKLLPDFTITAIDNNKRTTNAVKQLVSNSELTKTKKERFESSRLRTTSLKPINIENSTTENFSLIEKNIPAVAMHNYILPENKKTDTASVAKITSPKKPVKKFYIGLIVGIDATTVKFQKMENAGYSLGLLIGYELNKKWSVETGFFWDKKFYYTEGQYFNTEKIYIPPNSRITDVKGNCKMIELPIIIKYNFSFSKKSSWFATAGLSSYFMKKEDYNYIYYYSSTGISVARYKSYSNSSSQLFSVVQLSGGYTHKLGKFAVLRLEPYVKLPVKGVGIGKIPLLSTGFNVGIIKELF